LGKNVHQGKHEPGSKKLTQEKHNHDATRVRHVAESTRCHSDAPVPETTQRRSTQLHLQKPTLK